MYVAEIEIKNLSEKDSKTVFEVLSSEKQVTSDRAQYELKNENNKIFYKIEAKDATALRAILNSISMNLQIFEKTKNIENEL